MKNEAINIIKQAYRKHDVSPPVSASEQQAFTKLKAGENRKYIRDYDELFILMLFGEHNFPAARQAAYGKCLYGLANITNYDAELMSTISLGMSVLLSNSSLLRRNYSDIKEREYEKRLKRGSIVGCIQFALKQDEDGLNTQIASCQKQMTDNVRNAWLRPDIEFFEGLVTQNTQEVELALNTLLTTAHKRRNKDAVLSNLISYPAAGYYKLALLHGLKPTITHPLLPTEFLSEQENFTHPADALIRSFNHE